MNIKLFAGGKVTSSFELSRQVVARVEETDKNITLRLRNKKFDGTRIFKNVSPLVDKFIYDGELYENLVFVKKTQNFQEVDVNGDGVVDFVEDFTILFKIGG